MSQRVLTQNGSGSLCRWRSLIPGVPGGIACNGEKQDAALKPAALHLHLFARGTVCVSLGERKVAQAWKVAARKWS